ncbi:MAG: hypothetical protein E6K20_15675 [Gammaproteobacteria bacterium]|nr:MAG: hypothetical protein E6K20_15675 [Gammaproteobacteria bacterium]
MQSRHVTGQPRILKNPDPAPTRGKANGRQGLWLRQPRRGNREAEVIREMFHRFALGETMKSIARGLNGRKIPPPVSSWRRFVRSLMLPLPQSARAPRDSPFFCSLS